MRVENDRNSHCHNAMDSLSTHTMHGVQFAICDFQLQLVSVGKSEKKELLVDFHKKSWQNLPTYIEPMWV